MNGTAELTVRDVIILSTMLRAGAVPARLSRWFSDACGVPESAVGSVIADLTGVAGGVAGSREAASPPPEPVVARSVRPARV